MRIIKCGLREVALNDASVAFFNRTARRAHEIKTSAHLLCKAWILERFRMHETLPGGQGAVIISLFQDAVRAIGGVAQEDARLQELCRTTFPPGFALDVSCLKNWPVVQAGGGTRYATEIAEHLSRCYPTCGISWARDFNACLNIDRIAHEHLAGLTRPDYLCRGA